MDWNGFVGGATRLADIDLPRVGYTIGVGEDEVHAILDVEAAGSGFDRARRPKMLFEPHVFYRNLSSAKRAEAVDQGLAYKVWGTQPYPADSYPRLVKARAIDETAALRSASWGLGQILGENFAAGGFDSPQDMVRAFMEAEAYHLEAIVGFLVANKLDDDLRAHAWAPLARGYNGPGYAKNGYDSKLAAAFAKWARIPDTPFFPPAGPGSITLPRTRIGRGSRGPLVTLWQNTLMAGGYPLPSGVDGAFGAETETATKKWQAAHHLELVDGVVGPKTWATVS